MRDFIFKRRDDGLYILDLRKSADAILEAAKLISEYKPEEVTVVASRIYSSNPATKFANLTGVSVIKGRYVPGTMTNIQYQKFIEPKLIIVCDPKGEKQALVESKKTGVKVIGFCDSDNETKNVDLVVPVNNKGKRSLALVFYILTRELMMTQGTIKSYDEFKYDVNYFEQMILDEPKAEKPEEVTEKPKEEEAPKEETPKETESSKKKDEAKEKPKQKETKKETPKEEKKVKEDKKEEKPKPKESKKTESKKNNKKEAKKSS
jgi:small subunit ribosomal protein S2